MKAIVNPASASGSTGALWPRMVDEARAFGIHFDADFTERIGDATRLTREALAAGHQRIVVVGGDGSVNEAVNGFFDEAGAPRSPDAALGILARGTGCDFIKTLGIPKARDRALRVLCAQRMRTIDVGRCDYIDHAGCSSSRYFANIADLGIGGATVQRVNQSAKRMGGFASFLAGSLATVLTYHNQPLSVFVDDQWVAEGRFNAVIVANGQYFGGGMKIAPDAEIDDGHLHVVLLGDLQRAEIFGNFLRIYRGTHIKHPKVQVLRAQHVRVETASNDCLLDLDGEQPGRANAEFRVIPGALQVIC